jgi:D-alanine-D-alanine ligase
MKVLVLMGGISLERDVSLASGAAVSSALKNRGHEVIALDTAQGSKLIEKDARLIPDDIKTTPPDLAELARYDREQSIKLAALDDLQAVDVIFLAFHGGAGEDGTIQALLELANKKYTGSGVLASALAMNKAISKKLFEREKIPTPRWTLLKSKTYSSDLLSDLIQKFPPPVIIKPNDQGSTVGLTLVENEDDYPNAVEKAFAVSDEVLIEEYIEGRELTVAVLGEVPLPVVEILPKNKLYDYECKYTEGMCSYQCPADLSDEKRNEIQKLGLTAFQILGCRGYARVDFRMDRQGNLFCLEVNTLPGMTKTSLVPKAAKVMGISFEELIERIIKLAVEV